MGIKDSKLSEVSQKSLGSKRVPPEILLEAEKKIEKNKNTIEENGNKSTRLRVKLAIQTSRAEALLENNEKEKSVEVLKKEYITKCQIMIIEQETKRLEESVEDIEDILRITEPEEQFYMYQEYIETLENETKGEIAEEEENEQEIEEEEEKNYHRKKILKYVDKRIETILNRLNPKKEEEGMEKSRNNVNISSSYDVTAAWEMVHEDSESIGKSPAAAREMTSYWDDLLD